MNSFIDKIHNQNFSNRFLTKITLLDQAMVSGVNFVIAIILARKLGISSFGYFSLIWMIVLFAGTFHLALIVQPMLSKRMDCCDDNIYHDNVLVLQAILSTLSFVISYIFVYLFSTFYFDKDITTYTLPISFLIFAYTMQDCIRRVLFVRGAALSALLCDVVNYLGRVVGLVLIVLFMDINTGLILWLFSVVGLVSFITGLYLYNGCSQLNTCNLMEVVRQHWSFSKWLAASALLQWFTGNTFVVVAATLMGPVIVAVVKIAQNMMGVMHVVFLAMENFVPMRAAKKYRDNGLKELRKYLLKLTIVNMAIVTIFIMVFFVFPDEILRFIYGEQYCEYGDFVRIFIMIYFVVSVNVTLKIFFRTINNTRWIFFADLFATVFAVSAAYPLISKYGNLGLIGGTMLSSSIITVVLVFGVVLVINKERGGEL